LKSRGVIRVRPLEGGFGRWVSLGYPVEPWTRSLNPPGEELFEVEKHPQTQASGTEESEKAIEVAEEAATDLGEDRKDGVEVGPTQEPASVTVRYCRELDLPESVFLPGLGSARPEEREYSGQPWSADNWQEIEPWLFGVDLFNAGYFWEAHEAWERVWASWPKDSAEGLLLRGCIQAAAALLKVRLNCIGGVRKLSARSLKTWQKVLEDRPQANGLGLDLSCLKQRFEAYWEPLADDQLPNLGEFPRIDLVLAEPEPEPRRPV